MKTDPARRKSDIMPSESGSVHLRVKGSSMAPYIPEGSILQVAPFNEFSTRIGDPFAFLDNSGCLITHRCVGTLENGRGEVIYVARGDANLRTDFVSREKAVFSVLYIESDSLSYSAHGIVGKALSWCSRRTGSTRVTMRVIVRIVNILARRLRRVA
jgi:hypothetical protein